MEEYIEQYRKNGGYIKTLRKHIGHAPIITIGVGVIIENNNGEILLQKRKDNGKWAIIGGGMEILFTQILLFLGHKRITEI